jgi:ABC-type dipeptide/oligopeptide/nickel transport system permease subunit
MSERVPAALPGTVVAAAERRRRRIGLMPALPIAGLVLFALAGISAPWLAPYDPVRNDLVNQLLPPAWLPGGDPAHLLGTDGFGRDIVARLLFGARISLLVAAIALAITVAIGTVVGITAGYLGGWVDSVLMRIVDVALTLPMILVALVLSIAIGPSFLNVVLVIGLLLWPRLARLVRGETLLLKQQDYVRYARAIGVPRWRVALRHVVPNVLPTVLVLATLEIGSVILLEASLSFLGAGIPQPQASWGSMIDDGRALVATGWWVALFPGIAIMLTVMSSNALGDWLRDYLDPRTRYS